MAYTELVKNFNRIRDYMREFYVYGFKNREEYTRKSARSYDDERRRIESWLGDYMRFRRTAEGKNVFLSIDSRISHHNPLYKAWKTKSFTDGDITLHFVIMDIMEMTEEALPVSEIAEKIDEYLSAFPEPRVFDESTVRKKLKEYVKEGLLETEKHGKILYYKKAAECDCYNKDILDFFSETAPCGVIGSFLLDRRKLQEENQKKKDSCQRQKYKEKFAFKHHYITSAIDSEILCQLFQAIHYLQLDPLRDVIEQPINDLLDINGWDLQKALRLMYKSNPTLFEWLKSPIIYIETEFADEMRRVMSDYFSVKHSLYHYISMAEGNYKKYLRTEMVKAKKYFYVLRPLLAGQWILEKESPPPMLFSELVEVELPDEVRTEVEDLLKIKIHEPEIKKIPRVNRLNEYLESEIAGLREKAGKLGEEKKVSWEKLNEIFLKEV